MYPSSMMEQKGQLVSSWFSDATMKVTDTLTPYEKTFFLKLHLELTSEERKILSSVSEFGDAMDILKSIHGDPAQITQQWLNGFIELIIQKPVKSTASNNRSLLNHLIMLEKFADSQINKADPVEFWKNILVSLSLSRITGDKNTKSSLVKERRLLEEKEGRTVY